MQGTDDASDSHLRLRRPVHGRHYLPHAHLRLRESGVHHERRLRRRRHVLRGHPDLLWRETGRVHAGLSGDDLAGVASLPADADDGLSDADQHRHRLLSSLTIIYA
jgi:hypothetical protein